MRKILSFFIIFFVLVGFLMTYALSANAEANDSVSDCPLLLNYLRITQLNPVEEVMKLQGFLNDYEGANLEITGIFDHLTFGEIVKFQVKYADDILTPWGIDFPTGYVYITTRNKINEIYCGSIISLTGVQQVEIDTVKSFLQSLQKAPSTIEEIKEIEEVGPIGQETTEENGQVAVVKEEETETEFIIDEQGLLAGISQTLGEEDKPEQKNFIINKVENALAGLILLFD